MSDLQMRTRDDWENPNSLRSYLALTLSRGQLGLVLGAGVSKPFGLPDWPTLLTRLFENHGVTKPACSAEDAAERFLTECCMSNKEKYLDSIQAALYQGVQFEYESLSRLHTLAAVGAIVMSSRRGSASDVVTFNYDDLLETYLDYHGFVTRSIHKEYDWVYRADACIYHPHGFLPHAAGQARSETVVFDQHSYSKMLSGTNAWKEVTTAFFRRRVCLFLGLSGADSNFDSLVTSIDSIHPARTSGLPYWGVAVLAGEDLASRTKWETRGIYCHEISSYESHLSTFLFEICQEAARNAFRE